MKKPEANNNNARKRAEKRNKRKRSKANAKSHMNQANSQAPKTREEEATPSVDFLVLGHPSPRSQRYWELFQRSGELANEVVKLITPQGLEDMKARNLAALPSESLDHAGVIIEYEEPFIKDGRSASLAVAIYEVEPNEFLVGFLSGYAIIDGVETPPNSLHRVSRLSGLDGLMPELIVGTMVASRAEFHPDLEPLKVVEFV